MPNDHRPNRFQMTPEDVDPNYIRDRQEELGRKYAQAVSDYESLEEFGKTLLAEITIEYQMAARHRGEKGATNECENLARADARWKLHIDGLKVARAKWRTAEAAYKAFNKYTDMLTLKGNMTCSYMRNLRG
jgi:hypothetical protein